VGSTVEAVDACACLSSVPAANPRFSNSFHVRQISFGAEDHLWPSVSSSGDVVWSSRVPGLGNTWQVFRFKGSMPVGNHECWDEPAASGCLEQVTAVDGRNHERPVVSANGDILFFRSVVGGSAASSEVVRRSVNGAESVVEFGSQLGAAARTAGELFGVAEAGQSLTNYRFRDPAAGIDVRRWNVSGIGTLTNAIDQPLDFSIYSNPDINSSNQLIHTWSFGVGGGLFNTHTYWGRVLPGTARFESLGLVVQNAKNPRIADTADYSYPLRKAPEVAFLGQLGLGTIAESTRWGIISPRSPDEIPVAATWADITDAGRSGDRDWRVVYESEDADGWTQVYSADAPIRGPNQRFLQKDCNWGCNCYGVHACVGDDDKRIKQVGCALTVLSMALQSALKDFTGLGGKYNPAALNTFMRQRSLANPPSPLFTPQSNVDWSLTVKTVDQLPENRPVLEAAGCKQLKFDASPAPGAARGFTGPGAETSAAASWLRDELTLKEKQGSPIGYPIIVGVKLRPGVSSAGRAPVRPGHYVLVTGLSTEVIQAGGGLVNRFEIADPASPPCRKSYLDEYFDPNRDPVDGCPVNYLGGFEIVGRVIDPDPKKMVGLTVENAVLLVRDGQGRRTGYLADEERVVDEIPNARYLSGAEDDDESDTLGITTSHLELYPAEGEAFTLQILPLSPDHHGLYVWSLDASGASGPGLTIGNPEDYGELFTIDTRGSHPLVTPVDGKPLDRTAPSAEATLDPPLNQYGWTPWVTTVRLAASDEPGGSGPGRIAYSIDSGPVVFVEGPVAAPTIEADGDHVVTYYALDRAGNRGPDQVIRVPIDRTPPGAIAERVDSASSAEHVSLLLTASDNLSGHLTSEASIDGGEWVEVGFQASIPRQGRHTVRFRAVDWAGNRGPEREFVSNGTTGAWSCLPNRSPYARMASGLAELPDGRAVVTGGLQSVTTISWFALAQAIAFDPVAKTSALLPDMSMPRFEHASVVLPDGRLLVLGGRTFQGTVFRGSIIPETSSVEAFDPTSNQWSTLQPMPSWPATPQAHLLPGARVLVIPAFRAGTGSTFLYDAATNVWQLAPGVPGAHVEYASVALRDGRVLVTGGFQPSSKDRFERESIADAYLFDPDTRTFTPTAPMLSRRRAHAAVLLASGEVLVAGGAGQPPDAWRQVGLSSTEIYDPTTGTWRVGPTMHHRRTSAFYWPHLPSYLTGLGSHGGFSLALLKSGKVMVGGGVEFLAAPEILDPESNQWTFAPYAFNVGQAPFPAVLPLSDGGALLWTGWSGAHNASVFYERLDTQPSSANASVQPPANVEGWHNGSVSVAIQTSGEDPCSAAQGIRIRLSGATEAEYFIQGASGNVSIDAEGVTTVTYSVLDQSGTESPEQTLEVRIDHTPPSLEASLTKPDGSPYAVGSWSNQPVTVTPICSDSLSGLSDYPSPQIFTAEAADQFARIVCSDRAGNEVEATVGPIAIDRTQPELQCSVAPTCLWPPNHKLVDVQATVSTADSGSGVLRTVLAGVFSSEADDGLGDGRTSDDIADFELGTFDLRGKLRAERSGNNGTRTYRLRYEAHDGAGNIGACEALVVVDQKASKSGVGCGQGR
jgi:hypothetical protein